MAAPNAPGSESGSGPHPRRFVMGPASGSEQEPNAVGCLYAPVRATVLQIQSGPSRGVVQQASRLRATATTSRRNSSGNTRFRPVPSPDRRSPAVFPTGFTAPDATRVEARSIWA